MRPDLEAIRRRAEAATPGPWFNGQTVQHAGNVIAERGAHGYLIADNCDDADVEFIAHSRTDMPALLAYIDKLEKVELAARLQADGECIGELGEALRELDK